MTKPSTPGGGHTVGDYPNAPNIREWMRQYFGTTGPNTDIRFTYWHAHKELPAIDSAEAALRFGLAKGFRLTDAGRAKAYELGILSDDSPAVPIQPQSIFQGLFSGAAAASQIEGRMKLEQFWHEQLKAMRERCGFMTGVQKGLVVTYLHGATGKEPYVGNVGSNQMVLLCPRVHDVICAVEAGRLAKDFDARALLEWADGAGLTLTGEGLAALERLNTTKQANTRKAKTVTPSKRGPKQKYFLRRSCVKACSEKGFEQSVIEAAFDAYKEDCNLDNKVIPRELQAITGDTVKHDLKWLRDKRNALPGLQGDNKAEFNAFKKWLKDWTP